MALAFRPAELLGVCIRRRAESHGTLRYGASGARAVVPRNGGSRVRRVSASAGTTGDGQIRGISGSQRRKSQIRTEGRCAVERSGDRGVGGAWGSMQSQSLGLSYTSSRSCPSTSSYALSPL